VNLAWPVRRWCWAVAAANGLQRGGRQERGVFALVIDALPVFPLAPGGSLLVRLVLETSARPAVSTPFQSQNRHVSADLPDHRGHGRALESWGLLAGGLATAEPAGPWPDLLWNLAVLLLLRRDLPPDWVRAGHPSNSASATGVAGEWAAAAAHGDPDDRSEACDGFSSIKQLLLQTLLAAA